MHLFFDLDHTLWDFDKNAEFCLSQIFYQYLPQHASLLPSFLKVFNDTNRNLWEKLEKKEITHDYLREVRFPLSFDKVGISVDKTLAQNFNELFLELLPQQTNLIPSAIEILEHFRSKASIHILSNGFYDIQIKKIKNSGLLPYVDEVITQDLIDARKPDPRLFRYALEKVRAQPSETIMIGDSLHADVHGAENVGIKAIYFAPRQAPVHLNQIESLIELKNIIS